MVNGPIGVQFSRQSNRISCSYSMSVVEYELAVTSVQSKMWEHNNPFVIAVEQNLSHEIRIFIRKG